MIARLALAADARSQITLAHINVKGKALDRTLRRKGVQH